MRMLRQIKGVRPKDRERKLRDLRVENITLKVRQARLHWYGHMPRMDEENKVKQMMKMEVRGVRAKGRRTMM